MRWEEIILILLIAAAIFYITTSDLATLRERIENIIARVAEGSKIECAVTMTPLFDSSEDELVRFSFGPPRIWEHADGGYALDVRIDIWVENKTNSPLYIDWGKSTYIFKGVHEPVFRLGDWTPDFVPPGATVKASVAPSDQVLWSSTYGGWRARGWGLDREIDLKNGGQIGVYLTLIFEGRGTRTYTFTWWVTPKRMARSLCPR